MIEYYLFKKLVMFLHGQLDECPIRSLFQQLGLILLDLSLHIVLILFRSMIHKLAISMLVCRFVKAAKRRYFSFQSGLKHVKYIKIIYN